MKALLPQQLRIRENQLFLAVTIVIGVGAGLSAVLFSLGIERFSHLLFGIEPSHARTLLVPPLVSLVTGALLLNVPAVRGSGVPQTETAFHLDEGVIPGRVPFWKFVLGILCIGSGHSLGREGPSVQIGAGLASTIGRWLELSPARVKELVPVGAAGALAAAFNTPVAAVLFALEEIIGDMNAVLIGSAVVASVASVIVERSILGNEPLFHVPAYRLMHPAELLGYGALGIFGGFVSLLFCKGLLGLRTLFKRLPVGTRMFQPAMGGVIIGVLLLFWPAIMGVGYEYVDQALNGGMLFKTMAILCFVKLAATVISYSSGNAGGIFAPSLYIGAMAGGVVGTLVHRVAPFPTADPGAYALVGMGTLFAGIIRAPMTSVFMIFEITQDYQILVPLMVANMLSFAISKRYQPTPIYHALLHQDGIHLPSPGAAGAAAGRTASQLMAEPTAFVAVDVPARRLFERIDREPGYLVGARDHLVGVVTRAQLQGWCASDKADEPIGSLVDPEYPHIHADQPIDLALDRLSEAEGMLPVVSRTDVHVVEGVITSESILRRGSPRR